jgi:Raf kinase inhibitor-like YbhB/YbcL family protein
MRYALALLLLAGCARESRITLASPAFGNNQSIPAKYTCTGQNVSPPLQWNGIPANAKTLELTVDDPDAPGGHFTHWQLAEIPATTTAIPEGGHAGAEGTNGFGNQGYGGPCPPSGEHRYVFTLKARDEGGREVGEGRLVGRYQK